MFCAEIIELAKKIHRDEDLKTISEDYQAHNSRYISKTSLSPKLVDQTDPKTLYGYNALKFIQCLLYRSKSLIEGSTILLNHKKVLPSLICVRAHFETTGSLAYLLKRLTTYYNGNIPFEKLDEDLLRLSLGATTIENKECPDPINAMNLIDAADHIINKCITKDKSEPQRMFRDLYDVLSDYCHPNFHGVYGASDILHQEKAIIYHKTDAINDSDLSSFFKLGMSTRLFIHFYDEVYGLLNKNEIMPLIERCV